MEGDNPEDYKERSFPGEMLARILIHPPAGYLFVGLFLVLCYFIFSRDLNFFVPEDFTYIGGPQNLVPFSDSLDKSLIRHFEPWFLASLFWKIFLLLPAAFLLSVYVTGKIKPEYSDKVFQKLSALSPGRVIPVLSLISLIAIVFLIHYVFQKTYVTDDENAYVFQARIIEKGRLFAPAPPDEKSFDNSFIITKKMFTGKYTLAFPMLIALGHILTGSNYTIPVLLAVLTIILIYFIGRELYGPRIALLSSFLLSVSPFFLFNAATLLSHAANLFFLSVFCLGFFRGVRKNSWIGGLVSGAALGSALNIRQLTALGFGFPFGVYLLWRFFKAGGRGARFILACASGFGVCVFLTLWYNRLLSGSPFIFPFNVYDPLERMGFGPMLSHLLYVHTPIKGLENLLVSFGRLNVWLWGMPVSFLFILPILLRRRWEVPDRWCLAIIASVSIAYIFYYSPGVPDTGPIYYFELLLPLSLLSARGIFLVYEALESLKGGNQLRLLAPVFFSVSFGLGLVTFFPERALHIICMTDKIKEPYDVVDKRAVKPALVFIRSLPRIGWVFGYRNRDPWLRAPLIFCKDLGPEKNWKVIQRFPDRNYYILSFDGKKGQSDILPFSKEDLEKCLQSPP